MAVFLVTARATGSATGSAKRLGMDSEMVMRTDQDLGSGLPTDQDLGSPTDLDSAKCLVTAMAMRTDQDLDLGTHWDLATATVMGSP